LINRACCSAQALCVVFTMLLAACGGGGGGGSSAPDLSTAPGLSVSPASVAFAALQNGAIPPAQSIQITLSRSDAAFIVVSYLATPTFPTWLTQTPSLTGSGFNWTLTGGPITTSLATGTYTTTIRIAIQDAGHNVLAFRDVPVSYTIQPLAGLAANPQSLSFSQLQGGPAPAAQNLGISELGGASYAWNASIVYQSGSGWLNINGASSASGATLPTSLSIRVNSSATLGTLNALVRVTGNGNTLDVPVSFTVSEPQLTRSESSVAFNAASQGPLPPTRDVVLSTQGSLPLNYTTSVSYGAGATGWLTVSASGTAPGTVSIGVNTTDLALGANLATLTFNTAAQSVSVGISYSVVAALLTIAPPDSFFISTTSLDTALSKTVNVRSTGGPLSWTAVPSQPWVHVSPTSGVSGSTVTVSLDPAQLDTLDPGFHNATIAFAYTPPNGSPANNSVFVGLSLFLPKVTSVTPYVATSGTSQEVILRGRGFNNTLGAAVKIGDSTTVASYTVVSDTEIRVTHPSLTAGPALRVSIANQLGNPGIVRSTGDLLVVDPPVYTATTIAYPNAAAKRALNVIYDAERQALLVGVAYPSPGQPGDLFRYTFSGSAWSVIPASVSVAAFRHLAFALNGKKVIALSDLNITPFDATTLRAGTSTPASASFGSVTFFRELAVANDGYAVVTTGVNGSGFSDAYKYFVADGTLSNPVDFFYFGSIGAGADGSRAVVIQGGLSPAPNLSQYIASTSTFSTVNVALSQLLFRPVLNRRATRILINGNRVYDANFQRLGNVPGSTTVALSPDGSKAYTYSGGTILHAYDLNGVLTDPDPAIGQFPEIGFGTTLAGDAGSNSTMTISPDGGTLFIAGNDQIVVVPAP